MKSKSVLFVGCGDLGIRVAASLEQASWRALGLSRSPERLPPTLVGVQGDYGCPQDMKQLQQLAPDYLVLSFKPETYTGEGYRRGFVTAMDNVLEGLSGHRPHRLFMISSTRVYTESDGGWVDEGAELECQEVRAAAMVEAETMLLNSELPASVVRSAGLYGDPGGVY